MRRSVAPVILLGAALTVLPSAPRNEDAADYFPLPAGDEELRRELNECTTGLASGQATPDGRPLLWKNRDVGNANQEFHYYDDGRIPFISITYSGETDDYYGGVNAEGFAVENSNSYNLPSGPYENGFGRGDDDGKIHTLALATCRTVDDFARLLDSTNAEGRTLNCNYGAIDAFGGAAMFETAGYDYTRCDAVDAPQGFLVRSNYSYSGTGLDRRSAGWGPHRHDAAYALFRAAVERNELTPLYLFQHVVRDLSIQGLDPYPLPFDGYFEDYGYGCIPNGEAVCRQTTRGVLVVQGVRAGGRPDDAILWAMGGSMLATVATPLWVRAGSVPQEYNDVSGGRICSRGIALLSWVYAAGDFGSAVNTWHLTNPQGNGLWDYTLPLERWVYDKAVRFCRSPDFSYDRLEAFQNEIAQQVADSLEAWKPPTLVTEITQPVFQDGGLVLAWGEPDNGRIIAGSPRFYRIYRSARPFRDGEAGDLVAAVAERRFVDETPPAGACFYRVEAVY